MTIDDYTDKVRALLAKAESTSFPEEADALTAKAFELMAKHGIDEGRLRDPGDAITVKVFMIQAPYSMAKAQLLFSIGDAFGCKNIRRSDQDSAALRIIRLYGFASDLAKVEMLYTSLSVQARRALAIASRSRTTHGKSFTNSFLIGYAVTMNKLLSETKQEVVDSIPGSGLVLVERAAQVEDVYYNENPGVKVVRSTSKVHAEGYNAGKEAAHDADFRTKVSGARGELCG